ncbi:MAG: DUF5666 domain-containing protein [Terracidiphilus sp.]|jgi:hypothetical protein
MRFRPLLSIVAAAFLTTAVFAQDSGSPPPAGQNSGQGNGGGYGQRGGRGGGMGMMSRGVMGTVTEMAADHFTVKTEMGEVYTVHLSANTRFTKQPPRGPGGDGQEGGGGYRRGGGNPPQEIKATDIKVGDAIGAMGEIDATAKSVGATRVMLLDPETAKRTQEMVANYGKTWLQGKVTAISGTTITLTGALDNAPHTVVADENTTFRHRRDPVTLADIQIGDTIRVEGALKNGIFAATTVNVGVMMGGPPPNGPSGPPAGGPPGPPPSAPPQ